MSDFAARSIDRATPIPYYYQLQEILKEEIERGTWQPGDLLPSEAELGQRFNLSRTVIRKALDVLEADGDISRVKGKGSIVAQPKFRWEATAGARDWRLANSPSQLLLGRVIDTRRVRAGGHVGRLLGVEAAAWVFELTFTHEVSGRSAALSQMYLRPQGSPQLKALYDAEERLPVLVQHGPDVAEQLESSYGVHAAVSQVTVEFTQTNEFEANLLNVRRKSAAFLLSSLDLDDAERRLSFTRTVIRADQIRISLALRHSEPPTAGHPMGLMALMNVGPAAF